MENMSLKRSSGLLKKEGVSSKYFAARIDVKTERTDSFIPKEEDHESVQIPKEEDHESVQIPKEEKPEIEEKPTKKRRVAKVKVEIKQDDVEDQKIPLKPLPKNFKEIYKKVEDMRQRIIAPVDTMGCAEIPRTLNNDIELTPENYRFQLLVSLMLSSQTKDEINFKAMFKMKAYFTEQGYEQGITIAAIRAVDEKKLDELIFSVGFHSRKAKFIKQAAELLHMDWSDDIPNSLEGLVALPGVGPKMAFLTLQKAWNINAGIGVDTHVDRLAKMWGWVPKNTKNPEQTRIELEKWLPKEYWNPINPVLVGFGQSICLPRGRRCDLCTLSTTRLCSNVDRALLKKVSNLNEEEMKKMNKTLRGDITLLKEDIEDLA